LDDTIGRFWAKTPEIAPAQPIANGACEWLIGTIRRECPDWVIPVFESHLRFILREWSIHFNRGRPHNSLGLGVPDPPTSAGTAQTHQSRALSR
jgi:putative transposase